jgi:peptide/nickel transport system substrate-binding protein
MLDARAMSMASYRGAATLSAISVPPTGTHPRDYHASVAAVPDRLRDRQRVASKVKPYDPTIRHADRRNGACRQFGDAVPTDETAVRNAFGYGWWKQDIAAAEALLTAAGFTKSGNQWMMPEWPALRLRGDGAAGRRDQPSRRDHCTDLEPERRAGYRTGR